jgi:hypothetical protein
MDSLFKRIKRRLSSPGPFHDRGRMTVAAFGKHPGWDDHMDDLGLETPALVAMKRVLYVEGIGKNIDNGRWAELESAQSAIEFGHTFVWCKDSDTVAGRLWPSRDGRGRASYPMVVCVHCRHVTLRWAYDRVLPRLARLETECRNSSTANDVRVCLSECQDALLTMFDTSGHPERERREEADPISQLVDHLRLCLDEQGLIRVLYHINRGISAGSAAHTEPEEYEPSAHARVPVSSDRIAETSILWTSLLLKEYGPRTGVLAIMPEQKTWLDIIIGEPSPSQLYCLRASLEALPLTNTVPYKISDEFIARVRQRTGVSTA